MRLLPNRWAMFKLFGVGAAHHLPSWTLKELRESVSSLKTITSDFNLVIFIDGLDKFDNDHGGLIDLVKEFHGQPGVKVCVSSRPWNAFRDAFVDSPQLRMELLTEADIEAFVHGKFKANIAFAELQQSQPKEADVLMTEIVRKSKGVFLWVSLVTSSILGTLDDGDTLQDLDQLLGEFPSDLSSLYDDLWSRVHILEHKYDRVRLLRLVHASGKARDHLTHFLGDFFQGLPQTLLCISNDRQEVTSRFSANVLSRRLHIWHC